MPTTYHFPSDDQGPVLPGDRVLRRLKTSMRQLPTPPEELQQGVDYQLLAHGGQSGARRGDVRLLRRPDAFRYEYYIQRPAATSAEQEARRLYHQLTPAMRRILRLLVNGYSTDQSIAEKLHVQVGSIRSRITQILDITGMGNRLEAALFVVRRPELEALLNQGEEQGNA